VEGFCGSTDLFLKLYDIVCNQIHALEHWKKLISSYFSLHMLRLKSSNTMQLKLDIYYKN
jgi:hypothetical protein